VTTHLINREFFDTFISSAARVFEQEVVEDMPADDKANAGQHGASQLVAISVTGQIYVRILVLGTAKDDVPDLGPGQPFDLLKQSELVQYGHRLSGERIAANFVSRKLLFLEKERRQSALLGVDGGYGAGGTGTDDNQIVQLVGRSNHGFRR
jgi:hypothetical protein